MQRKLLLNVITGIVFVMLVTALTSVAYCAEWKNYGSTEKGDFYYDLASVKAQSPRIVQVWKKFIFTNEEQRNYFINSVTDGTLQSIQRVKDKEQRRKLLSQYQNEMLPKFKQLSQMQDLIELDCELRESRLIESRFYDSKSKYIDTMDTESYNTTHRIGPGSIEDKLFQDICMKKEYIKTTRNWILYKTDDKGRYFYDLNNTAIAESNIKLWRKHIYSVDVGAGLKFDHDTCLIDFDCNDLTTRRAMYCIYYTKEGMGTLSWSADENDQLRQFAEAISADAHNIACDLRKKKQGLRTK
jgi:hypothetical protein